MATTSSHSHIRSGAAPPKWTTRSATRIRSPSCARSHSPTSCAQIHARTSRELRPPAEQEEQRALLCRVLRADQACETDHHAELEVIDPHARRDRDRDVIAIANDGEVAVPAGA